MASPRRPLRSWHSACPGLIGGERLAIDRVAEAVAPLGLAPARLERLKTAVGETVMNAIEYGSQGNPDVPVDVRVDATDAAVTVRVTDRAMSGPVPEVPPPDLEAKLDGRQRPRGWGLFLIRHMVDTVDVSSEDGLQTVTLILARGDRPTTEAAMNERFTVEAAATAPGETTIRMRGDIDIAADAALAAAYERGTAGRRLAHRPRLRRRRLHQLHRHRPDRQAARGGAPRPSRRDRGRAVRSLPGDLSADPAVRLRDDRRRAVRAVRGGSVSMSTTVDVVAAADAAILRIHGDVTGDSERALMDAYADASPGVGAIVLDFADLEYMNSGGIGLLVTLLVRAQRAGQRLHAIGLSEHYRQILALTRLDEAIEVHDDERAALAAASA